MSPRYAAEEEAQGHIAFMHQMPKPPTNAPVAPVPTTASTSVANKTSEGQTTQQKLKALADKIPADKDSLFAYKVDWEACDRHGVVDAAIKPWVIKKFVEYLGEWGRFFLLIFTVTCC
jgi:hypothetical protein